MMKPGMMQGGAPPFRAKPRKMMADGGFGAPEPLGGMAPPKQAKPPAPPPPDMMEGGQDPDMDGDMDSPVVSPEALHYHDDPWSCSGCTHFQGGQCGILKMEVSPEGACNAFEAGQSENPDMAEDQPDATGDMGGMDEGGGY